jgi:hypothetical protein
MVDVSIGIVSYNSDEYLLRCINSIIENTSCDYEIIIVDNNSKDGSICSISSHPKVEVIRNGKNYGFSSGSNQAFRKAKGRYFLLLNPDTLVLNGAIDKLIWYLSSHPEIGAIGPKILNADLTPQVEAFSWSFPTLRAHVLQQLSIFRFQHYFLHLLRGHNKRDYNKIQEVDWLSGCALLVPSDVWRECGGMDERFKLYCEDVDLCYRIKKKGWKILYFPEAEIMHFGGKIEGKRKLYKVAKSDRLLLEKQFGPLKFRVWKTFTIIGALLRFTKWKLIHLVSDTREAKENLHFYAQILKEYKNESDDYWF